MVERVLEAERPAPLGDAPPGRPGPEEPNARPGKGQKTVQTDTGPGALAGPRARHGSGAPQRVPTRQRRLEGCAAKGRSREARGLSTRERPGQLDELEGTEVAPPLRSPSTDAVLDAGRPWPSRPLASGYPLLSGAALVVTSRQAGPVQTPAVSLALGRPMDGEPERPWAGGGGSVRGRQAGLRS